MMMYITYRVKIGPYSTSYPIPTSESHIALTVMMSAVGYTSLLLTVGTVGAAIALIPSAAPWLGMEAVGGRGGR